MRRILLVLMVAALMAALMLTSAMPAFAIRDSEYDAVGIRDEENRTAYDTGYDTVAIGDEENSSAYGAGCDTISCSNNL